MTDYWNMFPTFNFSSMIKTTNTNQIYDIQNHDGVLRKYWIPVTTRSKLAKLTKKHTW